MTSAEPSLRWLQDNAVGMEVEIDDVSDSVAAPCRSRGRCRARSWKRSGATRSLKYFRIAPATLRGIPVTDLAHRLYRRPRLRDLGRRRAGVAAVGRADRRRHAPTASCPRASRARHGAHRGWADAARRRLRLRAQGADRRARLSSPFELDLAWTVNLDKGPLHRPSRARARKRRAARSGASSASRSTGIRSSALRGASGSRRSFPAPPGA